MTTELDPFSRTIVVPALEEYANQDIPAALQGVIQTLGSGYGFLSQTDTMPSPLGGSYAPSVYNLVLPGFILTLAGAGYLVYSGRGKRTRRRNARRG